MEHNQLSTLGPQELAQRQQELVQHLNQVRTDNTRLHETVASSNTATTERFQALFEQIGLQSNAQREQTERLERAMTSQEAQVIEQTQLLQALVEQLSRMAAASAAAPVPRTAEQPVFTPDPSIPFPDGSFGGNGGSDEAGGSGGGNGGSNGGTFPIEPSIIKPQLPLVQPRPYKGERKDNACEQWCMDMYSFMRRFETLTGKYLTGVQAVEYISQYFQETALTWWTNLLFNIKQGVVVGPDVKKPTTEDELYGQLQKAFGDIHSVERRREKYESLKQTSSVQEFANKLKHHVLFLDPVPPAYEILRRFQSGLKPEIRAKMDEFHSDIKTLDAYINKADDIDRTQLRLKQAERKDKDKDKDKESRTKGRNYAIGSPIPSSKNDPDGYKQWCHNNKACFTCASKKHRAKDCPKKDSNKERSSKKKESENA